MKRILIVLVSTGAIVAGCNVKVPVSQPCPSGYHRLDSKILHRPTYWCGPNAHGAQS